MRILVTGAAGFIGSHLVENLLTHGHEVVGLDNFDATYDSGAKERNLMSASGHSRFSLVKGDILSDDTLEAVFRERRIDIVVHLAARTGVRSSITDPLGYHATNVQGTVNVLECARASGTMKAIYASSSSVYGNNQKIPFAEDDPVDHPVSPYAATKRVGEIICRNYHNMYGMDIYALRFFTAYGPRQRPDMAIHKFTRLIREGKPIPVFGMGRLKRDFTFIDDIIQGVSNSVHRVKGFEIINLGESTTISVSDLIGLIERLLSKKAIIEMLPMQAGDVNETFADIRKARTLIDYQPTVGIEEGVRRFLEWYVCDERERAMLPS
jgi:UDP-glucuronate 4-epimerase